MPTVATLEDDDENTVEDLGGLDDPLASLRSDVEATIMKSRGITNRNALAIDS